MTLLNLIGSQGSSGPAFISPAVYPIRILPWRQFAITYRVVAPITVPAVFQFEAAPPSEADPCQPGEFSVVNEVPLCDSGDPDNPARFTIPADTPVGTICNVDIYCKPNAFLRVTPVSGTTASVLITYLVLDPLGGVS